MYTNRKRNKDQEPRLSRVVVDVMGILSKNDPAGPSDSKENGSLTKQQAIRLRTYNATIVICKHSKLMNCGEHPVGPVWRPRN